MLDLLPTTSRAAFEARFRAIDTGAELKYHVAQGDKTNNDKSISPQPSQVLSPVASTVPLATENTMRIGDEEE